MIEAQLRPSVTNLSHHKHALRYGETVLYLALFPQGAEAVLSDILDEEIQLRQRLSELQQDHGDMDSAINALVASGLYNHLQVQRLKKKKLSLKDEISRIEDALLPDIIA